MDYSKTNERAFDFLVERYAERRNRRIINYDTLSEKFSQYLVKNYSRPSVLEIGIGSGLRLRSFSELEFKITAIDISSKMIDEAKKVCNARFIHSNFLDYNFGREKFTGIFADSVLHLFQKDRIEYVFEKVHSILEYRGYFYFSIPLFNKTEEEIVERGEDDKGKVFEFRVHYTENDFDFILSNLRFKLLERTLTDFKDSKGNNLSRLNVLLVK